MIRISRFAMVALLATAVAAPSRAAEVDNMLPKETEFVVQVNVKQMLESDIIKKYGLAQLKQTLEGQDAQKMLKDLGLDPMKDIEKLTIGAWGKDKDDMKAVAIVRGKFDAKKIMEAAQGAAKDMADKVSIVKEGDLELIKFVGEDGKPGYIAVAEGKPIIAGNDKKSVAAAAALDAKAKPALSKELTALILKQDAKASLFACGITEGKAGDIPGDFSQLKALGVDGDKIKAGLGKVTTLSMAVTVGKDVALAIKMGMKDTDSADEFGTELEKLVKAATTFLPIVGGNQPMFKGLIDDVSATLKSVAKDKDITISVKVTAEAIGKAAGSSDDKDK